MRVAGPVVVALIILFSRAAAAQQEQWLHYKSSAHPTQDLGMRCVTQARGSRPASPTRPNAADLPQFKSDKPLFFHWKLGKAFAERRKGKEDFAWVALDKSKKDGDYDLLYIDSNLDGRLSDETALEITADEDNGEPSCHLVEMLLSAEDGPVSYHLNLHLQGDGARTQLEFESASWYEGTVNVAGAEFSCTLLDGNANGQFNEAAANPQAADVIRLVPVDEKPQGGALTDGTLHAIGRYVDIRAKLYTLDIAPDGACVKITPAINVPTGRIRVPEGIAQLSVAGLNGHFYLTPKDGLVTVPAGQYVVYGWKITRKDKQGETWQLTGMATSFEKSIIVEMGREINLDIGEPVISQVSISRQGDEYDIRWTSPFKGRAGETVIALCDGRLPSGQIQITNANGAFKETLAAAFG